MQSGDQQSSVRCQHPREFGRKRHIGRIRETRKYGTKGIVGERQFAETRVQETAPTGSGRGRAQGGPAGDARHGGDWHPDAVEQQAVGTYRAREACRASC